ncbi:hypothetical protein VA596_38925 [Amycolatopsis sp., V23-08]|uniref:Uncharacterized protein n=1 Tax=Amycolatopsis heterodermiae TaxID=3110235 RepID=A0ABU5RHC3_9PSEU|nr:hypothetical protein [Amycolatopsis sp., V23-08]MEA5365553.1 hypothetical protein [Amycolatopsis sp., V23-08]
MKRLFSRVCLVLGLALTTAAVAVPVADAGPASAAACPAKGTRFVTGTGPTVYLVGPSHDPSVSRLYVIPDPATYRALWGDGWEGIVTLPNVLNCWSRSYSLSGAYLTRVIGTEAVFIWDGNEGFRHIVNWDTFANRYRFSAAMIGWASQGTIDGARGPDWT